jgi:predicted MFS family arabinose efflux permease
MSNFIGGMRASGNGLLLRASPDLQKNAGYLALLALLVYIASFAIGLYPTGIRSKAMSVATVANWGANFLVAVTFLSLGQAITRQGTFFLYTGLGVLAFMFFLSRVPETSNRSLEDIQQQLTGGRAE